MIRKLTSLAAAAVLGLGALLQSSSAEAYWPGPVEICEGSWCHVYEWLCDWEMNVCELEYRYSFRRYEQVQ